MSAPTKLLRATPWQTVGPFFEIGLTRLYENDIAKGANEGDRINLSGRVLDGRGAGVPDAVIEVWQANADGKYPHSEDFQAGKLEPNFTGFARIATDQHGTFNLRSIKPGAVLGPDGAKQAPHLVISVFMRGLLLRLVTRMYFPNDPLNEQDFILQSIPGERRGTLLAKRIGTKDGETDLQWNIILQGEDETVFFDL